MRETISHPKMVITEMGFLFMDQKITKNYELFVRYDQITSNILNGESKAWNYNNDGSLLMFGTQYQATKGVKSTLTIDYLLTTIQ